MMTEQSGTPNIYDAGQTNGVAFPGSDPATGPTYCKHNRIASMCAECSAADLTPAPQDSETVMVPRDQYNQLWELIWAVDIDNYRVICNDVGDNSWFDLRAMLADAKPTDGENNA